MAAASSTGKAPQVATGYSPGKIGLGRRNVQIFQGLSPADQVAYSRALFGDHVDATFAIALDGERGRRSGHQTYVLPFDGPLAGNWL